MCQFSTVATGCLYRHMAGPCLERVADQVAKNPQKLVIVGLDHQFVGNIKGDITCVS